MCHPVRWIAAGGFSVVMVVLALTSLRAQTAPTAPAPRSISEVDSRYTLQVAKLQREFDVQVRALRNERTKQLQSLLDEAMAQKNADAVVRLQNLIKASQAGPDGPGLPSEQDAPVRTGPKPRVETAVALQRYLAGTKWEWNRSDMLELGRDGVVRQANWQGRGLVTSWAAIDRRTVVLKIEQGRNDNRMAILRFDESLAFYQGSSFEGDSDGYHNQRLK